MAKIVNMFDGKTVAATPNGDDDGYPLKDLTPENVISTLRAAINGDPKAKVVALAFLDFYEQHQNEIDMFDDLMNDGEGIGDLPLTLPRPDVKEYHVRIKLNNIDIKIWREVKVPSNITLQALAELLLEVMGWTMEHLYGFRYKGESYCSKEQMEDSMFPSQDKDFTNFTLSDLLTEKGVRMKLDYDYGDSWEHDVWVKGIREYDKGEKPSITLVAGHGECPPENCGGVWGYADLLELTHKKKLTKEERERLEWYEMDSRSGFDPEYFDIEYFKEIVEDYDNALRDN